MKFSVQQVETDLEAKLLMFTLNLKEEKNKEYAPVKSDKNIVYLFQDSHEFEKYFIENGINDINKELLVLCQVKTTKKGTIIASKNLCDYIIKRYKMSLELTQSQIDEIHSRGKITPREKVKEWEGLDCCAPGDNIGSAKERCRTFPNCHECLLDYASSKSEYDRIEFKPTSLIASSFVYQKKN